MQFMLILDLKISGFLLLVIWRGMENVLVHNIKEVNNEQYAITDAQNPQSPSSFKIPSPNVCIVRIVRGQVAIIPPSEKSHS